MTRAAAGGAARVALAVPLLALSACPGRPAASPEPGPQQSRPPAARAAEPGPASRPNVVLVVFDDLYYKIGLYGHDPLTPNLARLAARGRRFDRAYTQFPICHPSRISLMTGWRPERTRIWNNADPPSAALADAVPIQDHFRRHGYLTARTGKVYHAPFEGQFRWDVAVDAVSDPRDADEDTFDSKLLATDTDDADEPDGRTARRAARILEQAQGRPVFLAVGFVRPHGPWVAPRRYFDLYPPGRVRLPEVPPGDLDDVPRVVLKRGAEPVIPPARLQEALAAYYACVTFADAQLGVLLDTLDRLDLWSSTIVVATSDHGIQRGEHGLWRKNVLFEESARVPLVIAAPGVARPGAATASLVELVDLYPTLTELAGLPAPSGLDGVSLVPILDDPGRAVRSAAFTVSHRGRRLGVSLRTDRYRYTWWRPDAAELYDHETDPGEIRNLAADPAYRALRDELEARRQAGPAAAILDR